MLRQWLTQKQIRSLVKRTGQRIPDLDKPPVRTVTLPDADNQGEAHFLQALRLLASDLPLPRCYAHPEGQYIWDGNNAWQLDFAWPQYRIAVEIQGQVHAMEANRVRDAKKGNDVVLAGWILLTFTDQMCKDDPQYIVDTLRRCCAFRKEETDGQAARSTGTL